MRCTALVIAILSSALIHGQESPAPSVPLFSGDSLRGWVVEHAPHDGVVVSEGSLLVKGPNAWIHTSRTTFKNFKLHFDIRSPLSGTRAFVAIFGASPSLYLARALKITPTTSPTTDRAGVALAMPLLGAAVPRIDDIDRLRLGTLVASRSAVSDALRPPGEWQIYDIVRRGSELTVMLNGTLIISDRGPTLLDGWIGFGVGDGDIALRNIGVTQVPAPEVLPGGVYLAGGPGVNLPQLVKEVKPNYTREAMEARVQGFVLLECVVGTDGGVSAIQVTRSLDQKFGLDLEAIKAASAWRFKPGTRSGRAVPVMVTIEVTFALGSSKQ